MAGKYPPSFLGSKTNQGWGGGGGGWRRCRGPQGLLPGQCSAAFGGEDHRGRHLGPGRIQQRFVEQNFEAWVWFAPFSDVMQPSDVLALFSGGNLDIISWSSSPGRQLPSCSCESQRILLEEYRTSQREDELGSPG